MQEHFNESAYAGKKKTTPKSQSWCAFDTCLGTPSQNKPFGRCQQDLVKSNKKGTPWILWFMTWLGRMILSGCNGTDALEEDIALYLNW
jgi:hypothetical protein